MTQLCLWNCVGLQDERTWVGPDLVLCGWDGDPRPPHSTGYHPLVAVAQLSEGLQQRHIDTGCMSSGAETKNKERD